MIKGIIKKILISTEGCQRRPEWGDSVWVVMRRRRQKGEMRAVSSVRFPAGKWQHTHRASDSRGLFRCYYQTLVRSLSMGEESTPAESAALPYVDKHNSITWGKRLSSHAPISYKTSHWPNLTRSQRAREPGWCIPQRSASRGTEQDGESEEYIWRGKFWIPSTTASLLAVFSVPGTALTTLSGLILIMSISSNYKFKQSQ